MNHARLRAPSSPLFAQRRALDAAVALALLGWQLAAHAQQAAAPPAPAASASAAGDSTTLLETINVSGNWLGSGLQTSVRSFPGARTVLGRDEIDASGAAGIGDLMRRIPGVQATENSGTAGSSISMNIGIRGLTGRYSPRSTVLLDGIPLAVAPYGQPQLSFAPVSLANIESVDVVRGGGAVRYGPQNVGGIINFNTRSIPSTPGLSGDVTVRQNEYGKGGGSNTQYSAFLGTQLDNGLGLALLYSGMDGRDWREASSDRYDDAALKFRYALSGNAELYGKLSYYSVKSRTPGGLTVAQYEADPFQNTRPTDFWNGERKGVDVGYLNTLSATQEFELRVYANDSSRQSTLIMPTDSTRLTVQPRDYRVLGIEPRYTQRLALGPTTHDVTLGYRYIRERGSDNSVNQTIATGATSATVTFGNETDAHSLYVDDKIAFGAWRVTPGVRFERIRSQRTASATGATFDVGNDKALPSINVAYLLNPALTLFANYNTSFGPVQNLQLNSQSANNPLQPEVAKTYELGARMRSAQVTAELTAFQLRFDNQILQVPGVLPVLFRNLGATRHDGVESAVEYAFDERGTLAGLSVYANYTYTRAIQKSGDNVGNDVPFYSRNTDTLGARWRLAAWTVKLSTTHQSAQFSDAANTVVEEEDASVGRIPGHRLWNAQLSWKPPFAKAVDLDLGVNNLADKRYYTRNIDGNPGRMVGAPRTVYLQGRFGF